MAAYVYSDLLCVCMVDCVKRAYLHCEPHTRTAGQNIPP